MSPTRRLVLKIVLPILVLGAGVGVVILLVKTKPEPPRTERRETGLLVETQSVSGGRHEVTVAAQGTVIPARQIVLTPQVGGRVTWQAEQLVPGGRFAAGEPMLRIDSRDYRLALETGAAEVDRAQLELELEQGRQVVARREWEMFGAEPGTTTPNPELALRGPHLRTAKVGLNAAESRLRRARLDLSRTGLLAPFASMVQSESVDVGQSVGPQSQLAVLIGTDAFWVQVSIPVEALAAIDVPTRDGDPASAATVRQRVGGGDIVRTGRVVRLLPDLDPLGRMARVLVQIDDPLSTADGLPMLLGAYVHVAIAAHPLDGVVELPRQALRTGDRVFVMGDDARLEIRDVSVAWREPEFVLVAAGLSAGDRVVTSRVPAPVDGMQLRVRAPAIDPEAGPAAAQVGP